MSRTDDEQAPPADDEPRRYPSTIGGALYLLTLVGVIVGVGVTVLQGWRTGLYWIAGGLLFAAACRLLLPAGQAGMLAVRSRWIDVLTLAVAGGLLVFLTASLPERTF